MMSCAPSANVRYAAGRVAIGQLVDPQARFGVHGPQPQSGIGHARRVKPAP